MKLASDAAKKVLKEKKRTISTEGKRKGGGCFLSWSGDSGVVRKHLVKGGRKLASFHRQRRGGQRSPWGRGLDPFSELYFEEKVAEQGGA